MLPLFVEFKQMLTTFVRFKLQLCNSVECPKLVINMNVSVTSTCVLY